MNSIIAGTTALVSLIAAVLAIFKYFDVRSKREQREMVGAAFKEVVSTLAGADRVERLASAILLRRFFSANSEYAKPDMPYAAEAIDVIASTLRGEPTGDVQKVLGDGLAYVSSRDLTHKDFQRVNLTDVYLSLEGPAGHVEKSQSARRTESKTQTFGPRARSRAGALGDRVRRRPSSSNSREKSAEDPHSSNGNGTPAARPRLDLTKADFFRANLSGASFKNDMCVETVFYESIAIGTIFQDADLTGANFESSDLRGASFKAAKLMGARFAGAKLAGAKFVGSSGLLSEISDELDDEGRFPSHEIDKPKGNTEPAQVKVFLSTASALTAAHRALVDLIATSLEDDGFEVVRLSRDKYNPDRHLSEVREAMAACTGVVVIGLPELVLLSGVWRQGTEDEQVLTRRHLPTPWNDLEAGIAVGLGLPVLSVRAGCDEHGVFSLSSPNVGFERLEITDSWTKDRMVESVQAWAQTALR